MSNYPNRNTLWASIFVDELSRGGLEAVCIAPGSRSTPLTLAFARHPDIKVFSHLDERSAAFFALGHAIGTQKPVALVCTSGTAAANWFPAVIEAYQSEVPLLLLTSDRPHELRHSGANQTIDQVKLYGDYALWAVDMALPEADNPTVAVRNVRTTANRAYATADGLRKGPAHVNFPFRKPLEPTKVSTDTETIDPDAQPRTDNLPYTQFFTGAPTPSLALTDYLVDVVQANERGIIVCGPRCPGDAFPTAIVRLAQQSGYPIFADPLSGVRFHPLAAQQTVSSYETFFAGGSQPIEPSDVIIRFGKVPTSKWLNQYLRGCQPATHVHVRGSGVWSDDAHITTVFAHVDEAQLCNQLSDKLLNQRNSAWLQSIMMVEQQAQGVLAGANQTYFDGGVIRCILEQSPENTVILAGNSLPIRHIDQFGVGFQKSLMVQANRGASGIDGNTSTALGLGAAYPDSPLVLISGDITFYHDMNGLLAINRLGIPITIVVINNDGGGIFHRLPIRNYEPEFTEQFITPHGLTFEHAATLYGLDYVDVRSIQDFTSAFTESVNQRTSTLIEVFTHAPTDEQHRQAFIENVHHAVKEKTE